MGETHQCLRLPGAQAVEYRWTSPPGFPDPPPNPVSAHTCFWGKAVLLPRSAALICRFFSNDRIFVTTKTKVIGVTYTVPHRPNGEGEKRWSRSAG